MLHRRALPIMLCLPLALTASAVLPALSVRASTFAVTVDHVRDDDNACATTGQPPCSLRDAVRFANTKASSDTTTIILPAGTYTLSQRGAGEDAALTGDLDLLANVTIAGADPTTTIIDGDRVSGDPDRIFDIKIGAALRITGVTLRNGTSDAGGAISSADGVVTLTNCIVTGNMSSAIGGALYAFDGGRMTLIGTTVSTNVAALTGGGLYNGSAQVTLTNSTFAGNTANANAAVAGGGIYNGSLLTIIGSTFSRNTAPTGYGGGIVNAQGHTLTVSGSTFTSNTASGTSTTTLAGLGGGICINRGGVMPPVTNSTFSGNTASVSTPNSSNGGGGEGGGLYTGAAMTVSGSTFAGNTATGNFSNGGFGGAIRDDGNLTVVNSTFTGNSATAAGGGIDMPNLPTLTVTNATLSGNAAASGGGIANRGSAVTLTNTIVASSRTGGDLAGPFTGTHNLVDDSSAAGFVDGVNGNIIGHPAVLGMLASNEGPTQTMALGAGSPARDAEAAVCAASPVNGKDQRGDARRADRCSIGAFEAAPANPNALPSPAPPTSPMTGTNSLPSGRPAGSAQAGAVSPIPSPRP